MCSTLWNSSTVRRGLNFLNAKSGITRKRERAVVFRNSSFTNWIDHRTKTDLFCLYSNVFYEFLLYLQTLMNASHHPVSIIACVRIKRTHSCATVPWDTLASCVKQVWTGQTKLCANPGLLKSVCIYYGMHWYGKTVLFFHCQKAHFTTYVQYKWNFEPGTEWHHLGFCRAYFMFNMAHSLQLIVQYLEVLDVCRLLAFVMLQFHDLRCFFLNSLLRVYSHTYFLERWTSAISKTVTE